MTTNETVLAKGESQYCEVLVIGAGITGVYQLYRLKEAGFDAIALEAGEGPGGVWHWNRYPGCRFDSESYTYGYFFSDELFDEWEWSEMHAGQPEIERYINFAVDKFNLRSQIKCNRRVKSVHYNENTGEWLTTTENGESYRSRFVVSALGLLSDPLYPNIPGREKYKGESFHTARWPKEVQSLKGKRVAIIGSAASAVQAVPLIAKEAEHLTLFQRTPNWCAPLNNRPVTDEEKKSLKGARQKLHSELQDTYGGFMHRPVKKSLFDATPEERQAHFEFLFRSGGLTNYLANYQDIGSNAEANKIFAEFYADQIRKRINDPELAEKLIPTDHGVGVKRPPMETNYYEAFNRPNVELVELKKEPIIGFTETGLETAERKWDFDYVIFATGFDALTGAWNKIDIASRGGRRLKDDWDEAPHLHFGILSPGFPNFFVVGGPNGAHGNVFRATEHQVDFVTGLLKHVRQNGIELVEGSQKAAEAWTEHVQDLARNSLAYLADNYASGANVPGKKKNYLMYHSPSVGAYRDLMTAEARAGYPNVEFAKDGGKIATAAPKAAIAGN